MRKNKIEKQSSIGKYWQLFLAFFRVGLFTFGGGLAMLPMFQKELVQKQAWLTDEEMVDIFALSQAIPGIIAVNSAAFAGRRQRGLAGAIVATLGVITPSIVIIILIAAFFSNLDKSQEVQKVLKGINVAVGVLLFSALLNLAKSTIKDWFSVLLGLAAFFIILFWHISGAVIVIAAAVIGIIWRRPWEKVKKEGK